MDETAEKIHAGCEELNLVVKRIKPRIHCFECINEQGGKTFQTKHTLFCQLKPHGRKVHSRAFAGPFEIMTPMLIILKK